jgi:hypothetical protein
MKACDLKHKFNLLAAFCCMEPEDVVEYEEEISQQVYGMMLEEEYEK